MSKKEMTNRVTEWLDPDETFESQYGNVSSAVWLKKEQERFALRKIKTEIKTSNRRGKKLLALYRE